MIELLVCLSPEVQNEDCVVHVIGLACNINVEIQPDNMSSAYRIDKRVIIMRNPDQSYGQI